MQREERIATIVWKKALFISMRGCAQFLFQLKSHTGR